MTTLSFLVLVIEKKGDEYAGYSPNVAGVSATGINREEVERSLLEQISTHVDELKSRHEGNDQPIQVTTGPIETAVPCLYIIRPGDPWGGPCKASAQKDGLCWQHWKRIYGHEIDSRAKFRVCLLCGEDRPYILGNWSQPCDFKQSNKDWRPALTKRRLETTGERRKGIESERREQLYASLPVQCRGETTRGVQCSNEAQKDGLCKPHWRKAHGHDYWSGDPICGLCGETDYDTVIRWDAPCPRK